VRPWHAIYLVAQRELKERVASRAFQVSTAFTLLLVIGALAATAIVGGDEPPVYDVGGISAPGATLEATITTGSSADDATVEYSEYTSRERLEEAVLDGSVDIGVVGTDVVLTGPDTPGELLALTTAGLAAAGLNERAGQLGLSPEDVQGLLGNTVSVVEVSEGDEDGSQSAIAFIGAVLLFVSILTYGQWILIGVVEEKSSRVVEVVLGAIPARHLLAGKVVGIGALGLAQLLLVAGIGFAGARALDNIDLPELNLGLVLTITFWFILGFAFYATGFAVTGSLVSRQEEAQNASFPLTMVMMVSYFVAATAIGGQDNVVLRVVSLIPPFSPITMPVRQASGDALVWEVVLATVLMIAATMLLLRVGGRIYTGGLLKTGGKVSIKEAFRSAENG